MIYLDNAATTLMKPPQVAEAMLDALRSCANPGRSGHAAARKAGETVYRTREAAASFFGLEPEAVQTDLFQDAGKRERSQKLSAALDRINRVYGRGTLRHLSEGLAQPWKMNRSMQAPRYTTSWDDLLQVK